MSRLVVRNERVSGGIETGNAYSDTMTGGGIGAWRDAGAQSGVESSGRGCTG